MNINYVLGKTIPFFKDLFNHSSRLKEKKKNLDCALQAISADNRLPLLFVTCQQCL